LPEVREALLSQLATNPHTDIPDAERFVFWGLAPDIEAADKVARITGHKSRAVFDAYAEKK
jgi:hypothetical protein